MASTLTEEKEVTHKGMKVTIYSTPAKGRKGCRKCGWYVANPRADVCPDCETPFPQNVLLDEKMAKVIADIYNGDFEKPTKPEKPRPTMEDFAKAASQKDLKSLQEALVAWNHYEDSKGLIDERIMFAVENAKNGKFDLRNA